MLHVYKCSLLKIIIGNCNTSKPHRGPLLDSTLSSALSLSLSLSLSLAHTHTHKGRCSECFSECTPLWKSPNPSSHSLNWIPYAFPLYLQQILCLYHFTFILHQCTCTYHFITASSQFTILLASCVSLDRLYKKVMDISKIWLCFSKVRHNLLFHPILHTCTATPTPDFNLSFNSGFCFMLKAFKIHLLPGLRMNVAVPPLPSIP